MLNDEEMKRAMEAAEQERIEANERILQIPSGLSPKEHRAYVEIVETLKESIRYKLSPSNAELIWQYCQLKVMRDRAWREYNLNPRRHVHIVTSICSDGKTPKVQVKENEHYKTLHDCNRHLERILKDLRLTPDARRKN